jgi:suppressor for copper-sensitivity B
VPFSAHAVTGEWQGDNDARARLISGLEGTGTEAKIPLGLEIQLAPGWHTYWREPGDAGIPPQIDWQNSISDDGNLHSASLVYPAPRRFSAQGMESIGYNDHVVLPIDASVRVPGKALALDAKLDLLVCSELCVPKHLQLHLAVPTGNPERGPEATLIDDARAHVPGNALISGLNVTEVKRNADSLNVVVTSKTPLMAPDIFIENDKNVAFNKPEAVLNDDKSAVTFTLKPASALPEGVTLADLSLNLTVVDGEHALEQKANPPSPGAPEPAPADPPALWLIIVLAIMGGFILNLMPCVLPVLSLKIFSVVSHGGGDTRAVRRSFLMTAAGILFSFMLLAGITIALKETGRMIGWGVQFQQPVFLVFLTLLLTLFAANLWGLFEISLPRFLADNVNSFYHPKKTGDFATGAFATLLATPCSAPFLGTAVGFALASGPKEILVIFAAIGFGMILPYLAIALWPRIATALPKPGAWMEMLRHLLGWALALTALWLIWILAAQVAAIGAFLIGGCMAGLIAVLYLRKRATPWKLSYVAFTILMLLPFGVAFLGTAPAATPAPGGVWQAFDESAIARYVSEGKTVFVDVTADWCLTCKANKRFTLGSSDVSDRLFNAPNVIAMQANWTNPDSTIASFLRAHGRYGIPFNVVFGPNAPQGIVLPELLTPSTVLDSLKTVQKNSNGCDATQAKC